MTERDAIAAAARGATALRELAQAVAEAEARAWEAERRAREAERKLADDSELRDTYRKGYRAGYSAARRGADCLADGANTGRPRRIA